MILRKGEFIKIKEGEFAGLVGQINRVFNIDLNGDVYPYQIIFVSKLGNTIKLCVSSNEIQHILYREFELEIGEYLKKVVK